ncbi:hypothetical protein HHL19_26115 [Streptomyces sp. R302]|uniref:hypothetical protein n=1 Tax=unclassified Streptomyces TaxID=2593676 RepID=UPI00145EA18C|nr:MULTISPECIES: hypothetical protein [unclassified Streptomyces]NML53675.1 hypothetical protein [Streptomyces sp. R301]NML82036.1 hypothetical protein [Streptomyces sp. R302]
MASSYDHLLAAEELLQTARKLLESRKHRRAEPLIRLASGFLEAAAARDRMTAAPVPEAETGTVADPVADPVAVPSARPSLPPWCGQCDGPEVSLRWICLSEDDEGRSRAAKCPRCHPGSAALRAPSPQAAVNPRATPPTWG